MEKQYDLAVIGAGPGGYTSAIRAAELGLSVCLIEKEELGGTCLNLGCIPTKTLLHATNMYRELKNYEESRPRIAYKNSELLFDTEQLYEEKKEVISRLKNGIQYLLKKSNVELIYGEAQIEEGNKISISSSKKNPSALYSDSDKIHKLNKLDNEKEDPLQRADKVEDVIEIIAKSIIIATGSEAITLDLSGFDLPNVVTSKEILSKKNIMINSLVIIGGGVIGVEFAMLYNAMGTKVTIIEAMDSLLPDMDKEISQSLTQIMKKRGIKIMTKYSLKSIEKLSEMVEIPEHIFNFVEDGGMKLQCNLIATDKDKEDFVVGDVVLIAVGRKPNFTNLFSPNIKIKQDGNRIEVGNDWGTSIKDIYAIGDVASKIQLAHLASAQGINLANALGGRKAEIDLSLIPSCIYTSPEIASVGLNLAQAEELGIKAKEMKIQMQGNAKSLIDKQERGLIKVVVEEDSEKIIGAHLLCNRATDMISEFSLAVSLGLTRKDLAKIIRSHPTYSEAINEALFQ